MITQKIKGWLQKLFAWWPWKLSTPIEHQRVVNVGIRGALSEKIPWSAREGTASQSGSVPCLSTLEDPAEPLARPRAEVFDPSPLPASAFLLDKEKEPTLDAGDLLLHSPATRQRLEFLRYLVQQGIVNEGFERREADS